MVADGVIDAICSADNLPAGIERRDLAGAALAPCFVDMQLNGCGGVPTIITSTDEFMRRTVEVMRAFLAQHNHQVLGLHLEGPYLSPAKKGTHNPAL